MLFIPIDELKGKHKNALLKFLVKYEQICVQLSAFLKKSTENSYAVFADEISVQSIYGIVCIRKTILHCLPFANHLEKTALQEEFVRSFADFFVSQGFENPTCINGKKSGTELLIEAFRLLENEPKQINEYFLEKLDSETFCKMTKDPHWSDFGKALVNANELEIFRCKKDFPVELKKQLLELQKSYEIEEVVPDCMKFDEDSCRLRLLNNLRTQYVLALGINKGEKLVCKAATNAIGFKFVQIGGVFTAPSYRGKKFCKFLMSLLLLKVLHMKRVPVLFVKKDNEVAIHLYESLQFKKIADYSIAYFTYNP